MYENTFRMNLSDSNWDAFGTLALFSYFTGRRFAINVATNKIGYAYKLE